AIAVLLKESGLATDRLATLVSALPGPNLDPDTLNTQEQAWTAAAGAVLGRGLPPVHVAVDGHDLPPTAIQSVALTAATTARNLGDRAVWQTVSAVGVPVAAQPAARAQMRISRQFLTTDGQPLDLDHLKQNTVFVLLLEGKADDGQAHRVMLQHGLPAGWEIAGRLAAGDAPGMAWLGKLSETEAQPAADDRYAAVVDLTPDQPAFRLAVRLRAVTPGTYELPGAEVSDMYRPTIFARQAPGRITVQAAE
ncbi:MAG TPA: alpha-2-macroglobulin family protein, partial [Acetobacteraceae bacterium]